MKITISPLSGKGLPRATMRTNTNHRIRIILGMFLCLAGFGMHAHAQELIVSGRVTDARTGDPVPFANVVFTGTTQGGTTDFEGYFQIRTTAAIDSISASFIGYITKTKAIPAGKKQVDFQLEENIVNLDEVVFYAGENPAYPIMRKVAANRHLNDKRSLNAYEYESYNKIEFDINNLTEKFRERKIVQKITSVMDSIQVIAGDDGRPVLPIFISESISRYYFRSNPAQRKEFIEKTRIKGVGIEDGTLVSQLIGSSFQEYNFYQNWLNIVGKEFISPIADGWKLYYDYDLVDSLEVDGRFCYRLEYFPRREQDLAFTGTIWIDRETFALVQINARVGKEANLNYVEQIKIQQTLVPTSTGPWMPSKTRVLLDLVQVTKNTASMLAKFYNSNTDFVINEPQDPEFYRTPIELADGATKSGDSYWVQKRHDPLTPTEVNVYRMIDTLRNIPSVKTITTLSKVLAFGYIDVGAVDIGPWPLFYANNNIEGSRFRMGGQTDIELSDKFILKGYLAYGTLDKRYKYAAGFDWIMNRKPWTQLNLTSSYDIQQIGLTSDDLLDNGAFEAWVRSRTHIQPYLLRTHSFSIYRQLTRALHQTVGFQKREFDPLFNFAWRESPDLGDASPVKEGFSTAELTLETKFGPDELFVVNDNSRISMGPSRWPIFRLRYTLGFKDIMGGDFDYQHLLINVQQRIKLGLFGVSTYSITGGKVFGQVPYPLLRGHIGNESPVLINVGFNTMNLAEFISDEYVSMRYSHHFEGFLLNRIPLMRKLKWRLVGNANIVYGGVRTENRKILATTDLSGNPVVDFQSFDTRPFVELGYGVENIFKVLRMDFFHRLTYLDRPDANKFAVKFSFQFIL